MYDVATDTRSGRGRQRHDGDAGELAAQRVQLLVVGSEVVAPLETSVTRLALNVRINVIIIIHPKETQTDRQ